MAAPGEDLHADRDDGWCLPAPEPRGAVHTRSIVCRSFRRDDGLIDIDARFVDTRPFAYDSEFRGRCAPGSALHNMQLRVTLDRERRIQALVSAMRATPYGGCAEVNPNFQRLVGLSVGRGFRACASASAAGAHVVLSMRVAAAVRLLPERAAAACRQAEPASGGSMPCWGLRSHRPEGPAVQQLEALSAHCARSSAARPRPSAHARSAASACRCLARTRLAVLPVVDDWRTDEQTAFADRPRRLRCEARPLGLKRCARAGGSPAAAGRPLAAALLSRRNSDSSASVRRFNAAISLR